MAASRLALLALSLAACRAFEPAPPPELRVPEIDTSVAHYAGSPLSGVAAAGAAARIDAEPGRALVARCEVIYVEREVVGDFAPVTSRARMVAGVRGDEPIRSTSELATEARVASSAAAAELRDSIERGELGRVRAVAALDGALPEGVTAVFTASAREVIDSPELGRVQKRVEFEVARGVGAASGDLSVALAVEDLAPEKAAPNEDDAAPLSPARKVLRREYVVLEDRPSAGGEPVVLVFPSPFPGGDGRAFVVRIAVEAPDGDAAPHAERVARALRDAAAAEERAHQRTRPIYADEARQRQLAGAVEQLQSRASRRAALLFLAGGTQAELCGDFALACDDATLDAFVDGLGQALGGGDLAFALERATLAHLAARKSTAPLPPELDSVLARHTGEVGRSAGGLEDLLATATDVAGLRARVVEENRIFLEDSSLAARVRAFDWLAARELAPAGFDPLGTPQERRAALDEAEAAAANAGGR